jgi:formyltetrahydrofolate deformylase
MLTFILTLSCQDKLGIVAAIAGGIASQQGNILESAQYGDAQTGQFFMRVKLDFPSGEVALRTVLQPIAERFAMYWRIWPTAKPLSVLVVAGKSLPCPQALLHQAHSHQLPITIKGLASNHTATKKLADFYGVPFHQIPNQEALLPLCDGADLVVLARYMQVLPAALCQALEGRCVNIHHSFLPSFKGADPYGQAHARGVKLIGATAHFVTPDLDEGPIITQETMHVTHAHSADDLRNLGQHLEVLVLTTAVKQLAEQRVLLNGHKTVVL